jgi:hypothetical protein
MSYATLIQQELAQERANRDEYYRLANIELHKLAEALNSMPNAVRRHADFASEVLWPAVCLLTSDEQEQQWAEAWVLEYLRDV